MRKVILVRPEGPRNVGMVLRTATNFGSVDVVLVSPRRASMLVNPDFVQMSHGVPNARGRVKVVETLDEAIADCTHVVGFTARARRHRPFQDWREAAPEVGEIGAREDECVGLVFGNEVEGLGNAETDLCHRLVHIRTSSEHTSINLSMAVGIGLFGTYVDEGKVVKAKAHNALRGNARLYLKEAMKDTFAQIARSDSVRTDIVASVDRVISSAPLESRDGRAWHAILRALGNHKVPSDYGIEDEQPRRARRAEALARSTARTEKQAESDPKDATAE
jgi:TrmH family RNA methyltransferase